MSGDLVLLNLDQARVQLLCSGVAHDRCEGVGDDTGLALPCHPWFTFFFGELQRCGCGGLLGRCEEHSDRCTIC